jgi:DNA invertase Pin-like site-specific DNA recombinase
MARQARRPPDEESAQGSKQTVEAARLDRLEQQVRDLEKRVFELENTSTDTTSTP